MFECTFCTINQCRALFHMVKRREVFANASYSTCLTCQQQCMMCFSFPFLLFTAASAYQLKQTSALLFRTMSTTDSSSDSEILGVLGSDTSDTVTYRDAPTILLRFPLPECTSFRFHEYLEKTADVFYRLIFDYHQEKKACEDHGTQWQPDDALHETVYQTQLLTMAFLDGHYRTPALVIETVNNLQRRAVVQLAIQNLKDLYPFMVKENLEQIFVWLFYKHAPILRHTGQPLDFIVQRLNISADTASSLSSPHGEAQ